MLCIVDNESGDYFVIPTDKKQDWENWLSEYSDEVPEYADYIGGFPNGICFPSYDFIKKV